MQAVTLGNQQLRLHNVHASNLFGYRVLYLHTWVNFDEVEIVPINQKLNGSSTLIIDTLHQLDRGILDTTTHINGYRNRWCKLDNLLVTTLN